MVDYPGYRLYQAERTRSTGEQREADARIGAATAALASLAGRAWRRAGPARPRLAARRAPARAGVHPGLPRSSS
jgi:hypothetical protein